MDAEQAIMLYLLYRRLKLKRLRSRRRVRERNNWNHNAGGSSTSTQDDAYTSTQEDTDSDEYDDDDDQQTMGIKNDAVKTNTADGRKRKQGANEQSKPIHYGVKCTFCATLIVGHRYKCVQCDSVNLCSACEAGGVHPEHCVMRIPNPNVYLTVVNHIEAIKRVLNKSLGGPVKKKMRHEPPSTASAKSSGQQQPPLEAVNATDIKPDLEQYEPKIEIPVLNVQFLDPLDVDIKQELDEESISFSEDNNSTGQDEPNTSYIIHPTSSVRSSISQECHDTNSRTCETPPSKETAEEERITKQSPDCKDKDETELAVKAIKLEFADDGDGSVG